jgi:hypothetical protein
MPDDLKIINSITYNPNAAVIYPSNIFHSVQLDKTHEKNNPRSSLRLSYVAKVKKLSLERKYSSLDTIKY